MFDFALSGLGFRLSTNELRKLPISQNRTSKVLRQVSLLQPQTNHLACDTYPACI